MSRKYKVRNPKGVYFITSTVIGWIDLFTRPCYKDILLNSLKYCSKEKGLNVHAYVIMTNHIHLLLSTKEDHDLANIMRDFKSFTSKRLIKEIKSINESCKVWLLNKFRFEARRQVRGKNYKIWQDGFHPVEILSADILYEKLEYIHQNPVVQRVVNRPQDYVYSSARNYVDEVGEMEVELII